MSTTSYNPRAGSVAERVIRFLADNPDEVLTTGDIAVKFEASRNNVHSLLAQAVAAGLLVRAEDPGEGELVYRAGQGNAPAPAPAPATPFSAHRPFPAADRRRSPVYLDVSAITLDDDVPLPLNARRNMRDDFMALMRGMAKGQSFAVADSVRASVRDAATALKKEGAGQWTIRDGGDSQIRCWRLS